MTFLGEKSFVIENNFALIQHLEDLAPYYGLETQEIQLETHKSLPLCPRGSELNILQLHATLKTNNLM